MTLGRCSDPDPGATNPKRSATIRRTQITEKRGYWTSLLGSLVGVHFGSVVPFKPNEKERIRYDTTITPSRINSPSTMRSFAPQHASVMAVVLLVLAELRTLFHVPQDVWLQADPPLSGRIQFILTTESSHESDHPNNDTAPSAAQEESIPSRDEVTYLYGEEPVLLGLERCAEYRAARDARNISVQDQHLGGIRIAGMYNTGTNAIAQTLLKNLEEEQYMPDLTIPEFKERNGWQPNVIWGKHSLLSDKYPNSLIAIERNSILPVVMIRDPYRWMKSIVRNGLWRTGVPSVLCPRKNTSLCFLFSGGIASARLNTVFRSITSCHQDTRSIVLVSLSRPPKVDTLRRRRTNSRSRSLN